MFTRSNTSMATENHETRSSSTNRRCSMFVPLLVGQFNDIIEWKAQIVQNELDLQMQRAQNFVNYERRYSYSNDEQLPGLQRSLTDSSIAQHFHQQQRKRDEHEQDFQKQLQQQKIEQQHNVQFDTQQQRPNRIIKLRRSKTQKCFSKKFNQIRSEAISNTINEESSTTMPDDFDEHSKHIKADDLSITSQEKPSWRAVNGDRYRTGSKILIIKKKSLLPIIQPTLQEVPEETSTTNEQQITENETNISPETVTKLETKAKQEIMTKKEMEIQEQINKQINIQNGFDDVEEPKEIIESVSKPTSKMIDKVNLELFITEMKIEADVQPDVMVPEPPPTMSRHNVLLEKLAESYRHHFEVKTVVYDGSTKADARLCTHCGYCGRAFTFSEKYLRCLSCLTACHSECGPLVSKPCIRYVDAFLKPSKLITNYVYPRSKPSIPSLLVNCCREIEKKCQRDDPAKLTIGRATSFELYYIQSEMLKPVKEQCKRLLQQAKFGYQRLDDLNLDYLCGMVKYFLADIIEPLFPKTAWKDYSLIIQKKNDEELKSSLLETLDQMPVTNVHTLCFMLIHLKHLNRCGFQDLNILADIFCPILLGDLECKRKIRLMKLMFQIETNTLVSYVES